MVACSEVGDDGRFVTAVLVVASVDGSNPFPCLGGGVATGFLVCVQFGPTVAGEGAMFTCLGGVDVSLVAVESIFAGRRVFATQFRACVSQCLVVDLGRMFAEVDLIVVATLGDLPALWAD